jgi:hypothetical protein
MPMRLRFTIRDLLWLTLVVAMGLGWWLDHQMRHPTRYSVTEYGPELTVTDNKTGETWLKWPKEPWHIPEKEPPSHYDY